MLLTIVAMATGPTKTKWSMKVYLKKSALKMLIGLLVINGMAAVSAISPAENKYASLPFESIFNWLMISSTIGVKIKTALSFAKRILTADVSKDT
jgi:hypothetical protein